MKKRTIIAMLLLICIILSACGRKPASNTSSDKATSQVVTTEENGKETKATKAEPEERLGTPEISKTSDESSEEMKEDSITEDWPNWFSVPAKIPEDEEVKHAIQGKEFDALPKWMQVIAVRPHAVVNWLSMVKGLVDKTINTHYLAISLKKYPEYIVPLMSRLKTILEKAETGEADINNPPPEYAEIQKIISEVMALE